MGKRKSGDGGGDARGGKGKKRKQKKSEESEARQSSASSAPVTSPGGRALAPASDGISLSSAGGARKVPTPKSDGKKGMSSALMNMKFMQRNKAPAPSATSAPAAAVSVAAAATPTPDREVAASRPEPTLFGRRSFGGFNPTMEDAEAAFYRSFGTYVAPKELDEDDEDMVARFKDYVGGRRGKALAKKPAKGGRVGRT